MSRRRRHAGGRPPKSRRVCVVPVRTDELDHRALARILIALFAQAASEQSDNTTEREDQGARASQGGGRQ